MVVLDTCALIEVFREVPSFSAETMEKIELGACILSISFAEIACKVKLGKLEMSRSPKALFEIISDLEHVTIIDMRVQHWLDSIDLHWPENKDPTDRLVTAFAIKNHYPVVTTDGRIKSFYENVIW